MRTCGPQLMGSSRPRIDGWLAIDTGAGALDEAYRSILPAPMKTQDVVAVSTFRSTASAQKAKRILDLAGIESMIRPEPQWAGDPDRDSRDGRYPHSDGAQLMVRAEDVERALEALQRSD